MTVLVYQNTKTTLPGWVLTVHEADPRGIAYEVDGHFVHLYGRASGLWLISTGLTATQQKQGSLNDWIDSTFGAQDIESSLCVPGETISGIWRPGILSYDDIRLGLSTTDAERHSALQTVRLLLERLDDLLLYIEPTASSLSTYGHKTRELLILACTEVENAWKHYMRAANAQPRNGKDLTTQDYVRLAGPLFLSEYEVALKPYHTYHRSAHNPSRRATPRQGTPSGWYPSRNPFLSRTARSCPHHATQMSTPERASVRDRCVTEVLEVRRIISKSLISLVEPIGIEPTTSAVRLQRSPI